jgi:hypothetical protein
LNEATRHHDEADLSAPLALQETPDDLEGFLASRADERTGVDHHGLGRAGVVGDDQALLRHPPEDQLRVDQVAGAAQVDEGDEAVVTHGLDGPDG